MRLRANCKWHWPSGHEPEQFIHPLIHAPIHIIDVGAQARTAWALFVAVESGATIHCVPIIAWALFVAVESGATIHCVPIIQMQ